MSVCIVSQLILVYKRSISEFPICRYNVNGVNIMDVRSRILSYLEQRQWSIYRLAKECDMSSKTLYNMFTRKSDPELATLEVICGALGISLSQFFAENEIIEVTPGLKERIALWNELSPKQQEIIEATMNEFRSIST